MTANEMRARFLLGYEGARLANRTFNDREISDFLNKAQLEFIKQRYDKFKNRTQRGYGADSVRASELAGLTTGTVKYAKQYKIGTEVYNQSAGGTDNPFMAGSLSNGALRRPDYDHSLNSSGEQESDKLGLFVPIPDEALYILLETADLVKDTDQRFNIPIKEITYRDYMDGIYDPYANPYRNLVWSMDWGSFTTANMDGNGNETPSSKNYTTDGISFNMEGESTPFWDGIQITTKTNQINSNRSRQLIAGKGYDVVGYFINYIVLPSDIEVDVQNPSTQKNCVLPNSLHLEIVDMAVKLASASIVPEPNKYQVNQIESKEDE